MEIRKKIIRSAMNQFITYGVKSVTMNDIATGLGMSKRTIYENFANKQELLTACVDQMHNEQESLSEEIRRKSETIMDEIFLMFSLVDDNYEKRGKFASEIKRFYPDLFEDRFHRFHQRGYAKLKETIERGIRQGVILPDVNVEFAVFIIFETLFNVVSSPERILKMNVSVIEAFTHVFTYIIRGFSTDKGIRIIDEKYRTTTSNQQQ